MNRGIQILQVEISRVPAGLTRIDSYIADTLRLFSRSQAKRRVLKLLLNGKEVKLSRQVKPGDHLEVHYSHPPAGVLIPEAIALDILYEDRNVLVINKPSGMVVHPGCGNPRGTLVNAVLHRYHQLRKNFSEETLRPGIVHRLDKDTSGVIITAKNPEALEILAEQFRTGAARKLYLAVVGRAPILPRGRIETLISRDPHHRKRFTVHTSSGKRALTYYRVLRTYSEFSLIALRPKTGRTHQLRVHMAHLGRPILGDPVYGRRATTPLLLHAYKLWIRLPGQREASLFRAPLPARFVRLLKGPHDLA